MNKSISDHLRSIIDTNDNTKYNLDKNHIFYSIHSRLTGKVSTDERMIIFFHFEEIKKILNQARRSQMRLANLRLLALEKQNLKYSNKIAEIGMEAIHLPMLAYLDYVNGDFDNAEVHLKKSIDLLKVLVDSGIDDCKIAALEQYFNLFKIYVNVNKAKEAANIVLQLFSYIIGKPSELINFLSLNPDNLKEQLDVLHFYVNGVLKVLLVKSKKDTSKSILTKQEVLNIVWNNLSSLDFDNALVPYLKEMLLFILSKNEDFDHIYNLVPVQSLFNLNVPSFVQFSILKNYANQKVTLHDSDTYADDLEISKEYSKKILDLTLSEV